MKCWTCEFKRDINLPYRKEASPDLICCHPNIAIKCSWVYAGKIITQDGSNPEWCPEK